MNRKRYVAFILMLMLLLLAAACSDKKNENEKVVADEPTTSDAIEDDEEVDENSEMGKPRKTKLKKWQRIHFPNRWRNLRSYLLDIQGLFRSLLTMDRRKSMN